MKLVDFAKANNMTVDDAFELARKADAAYVEGNFIKVDIEKVNKKLDVEIAEELKAIG